MKYLFVITGIAYGHLTREEAIINKIKKLDKKAEIIIAGYETSYKYFKGKYNVLKLFPVIFSGSSGIFKSGEIFLKNYKLLKGWMEDIKIVNAFIKDFKPDVVISDWEPFALFVKDCDYLIWNYKSNYAKANTFSLLIQKILIGMSYFTAGFFGKNIILPSLHKEKENKKIIFTNPIVRKTLNEVKPLNKYKNSILVMIGGSDFGWNLSRKIKNISREFKEKFIFFGYGCKSKNCIGYKGFKKNYLEYLKSCKGVISLGGYSGISESIFFKKPNLAFPIKGQLEQYAVIEEFRDYIEVGDIESSEEELKIKIKDFLKNSNKLKKKLNSLKLKNGADEIAQILYKRAKA
tara:strand:+ start:2855 stop:3898 length:1044 start_codon:yes stop_codon:yes gene_type:complete